MSVCVRVKDKEREDEGQRNNLTLNGKTRTGLKLNMHSLKLIFLGLILLITMII